MTERLVEARARIEQFLAHIGQYQRHIGGLAVEDIRALLDTSRAVDEPTEAMIAAGQRAIPFEAHPSIIRNIYNAMRRAAQEERE